MSKGKGHDNLAMTEQPSLPGYGPPLGTGPPLSCDYPPSYSEQPAQQQYGLDGWRAYGYDTTNTSQQQFGAPVLVPPPPPVRETGTPPDTSSSFVMSIVAIVLCLPTAYFAVAAAVYSRKANGLVESGQYTAARKALRTVKYLLVACGLFGILAWGVLGYRIYQLVVAVERID